MLFVHLRLVQSNLSKEIAQGTEKVWSKDRFDCILHSPQTPKRISVLFMKCICITPQAFSVLFMSRGIEIPSPLTSTGDNCDHN